MNTSLLVSGLREAVDAIRPALGPQTSPSGLDGQRLYERWLRGEAWRLRAEALPLLYGVAPGVWAEAGLGEAEARLWDAVKAFRAAGAGLPVVNPEAPEDEWRVRPADWYQWSRAQGVALPEAFEVLMGFILRVVRGPQAVVAPPGSSVLPPVAVTTTLREQVLGAALNVLAKCADQCHDEHGLVSGERIAERIGAQSLRWFDAAEPPMDRTAMAELIDRWLE